MGTATAVDTARGRLRLSPATGMAAMVATGVADTATARGRLRLSPATAMVVMAADMEVTAVDMAMARGRLSPATAMAVMAAAMAAMVATVMAVATATGVSYHRRRRSELSQKQNRTKKNPSKSIRELPGDLITHILM